MTKKFKHLRVPETWEQYWSRYPQGYTIMEALINWVSQVNEMSDNINDWNAYLDDFVKTFDKNLQGTVTDMLKDWYDSGFLAEIINNDVFDMKANQKDLDKTNERLAEIGVNVKDFGAKGDGITDDSQAIQNAINYALSYKNTTGLSGSPTYLTINIDFPTGIYLINSPLVINTFNPNLSDKVVDMITVSLRGRAKNGVIIKAGQSLVGPMIDLVHGTFDISNLKLIGTANTQGFRLGRKTLTNSRYLNVNHSKFTNIQIFYSNKGFIIECAWDCSFYELKFDNPLGANPVGIDIQPHENDNSNNLNFWRCHFEPSMSGTFIRAIGTSSDSGYHHDISFFGCHFETRSFATNIFDLKYVRFIRLNNCQLTQNNNPGNGVLLEDIVPMFYLSNVTQLVIDACSISINAKSTEKLNNNIFELSDKVTTVIRDSTIMTGVSDPNLSIDSLYQSNPNRPFTPIKGLDPLQMERVYINDVYFPPSEKSYSYINSKKSKNNKWVQMYDEETDSLTYGFTNMTDGIVNSPSLTLSKDSVLTTKSFSSTLQAQIGPSSNHVFSVSYANNPNKRGIYLIMVDDPSGQSWAIVYNVGGSITPMVTGANMVVSGSQETNQDKFTIYPSGTNIAVNNGTTTTRRVLVVPFSFT